MIIHTAIKTIHNTSLYKINCMNCSNTAAIVMVGILNNIIDSIWSIQRDKLKEEYEGIINN